MGADGNTCDYCGEPAAPNEHFCWTCLTYDLEGDRERAQDQRDCDERERPWEQYEGHKW